jgi:hypothetical protein
MTHLLHRSPVPARRVTLAAFVAALLGVAAVMTLSAGSASAAEATCDAGEFCLYFSAAEKAGIYEFSGSDSNLDNDYYENYNTDKVVGQYSMRVFNNGVSDPNGRVDVVAYDGTGYTGPGLCIRQHKNGVLPFGWHDRISSYKWVTPAECGAYPQMP